MNEESIGDANHDEAAEAFKQAGNHVQLLVRYSPVEFNRFQVCIHTVLYVWYTPEHAFSAVQTFSYTALNTPGKVFDMYMG